MFIVRGANKLMYRMSLISLKNESRIFPAENVVFGFRHEVFHHYIDFILVSGLKYCNNVSSVVPIDRVPIYQLFTFYQHRYLIWNQYFAL